MRRLKFLLPLSKVGTGPAYLVCANRHLHGFAVQVFGNPENYVTSASNVQVTFHAHAGSGSRLRGGQA